VAGYKAPGKRERKKKVGDRDTASMDRDRLQENWEQTQGLSRSNLGIEKPEWKASRKEHST
jgi:hypothetical protein